MAFDPLACMLVPGRLAHQMVRFNTRLFGDSKPHLRWQAAQSRSFIHDISKLLFACFCRYFSSGVFIP